MEDGPDILELVRRDVYAHQQIVTFYIVTEPQGNQIFPLETLSKLIRNQNIAVAAPV